LLLPLAITLVETMTDAATQMEQRCGEEEDDQELVVAARSAIALAPLPPPPRPFLPHTCCCCTSLRALFSFETLPFPLL